MQPVNTITNLIDDLSIRTLSKAEQIVQSYNEQIYNEKTKIFDNRNKFKKPPTVDTVLAAIENRRINMIERAQYHTGYILKIFFDPFLTQTIGPIHTNTQNFH